MKVSLKTQPKVEITPNYPKLYKEIASGKLYIRFYENDVYRSLHSDYTCGYPSNKLYFRALKVGDEVTLVQE